MPPGGATPIGTFGALSAAFELAEQIEAGLAPRTARIVLAVGSTCTTAGLLAGIALAAGHRRVALAGADRARGARDTVAGDVALA